MAKKPYMSTAVHEAGHAVAHLAEGLCFIRVYVRPRAASDGELGCTKSLSPLEQKRRLEKRGGKRVTYRTLAEHSVVISYAGPFAEARYLHRGFGPLLPVGAGEDCDSADEKLKYIIATDRLRRFYRKRNVYERLEAHQKEVRADLLARTYAVISVYWPEIMAVAKELHRRGSLTYGEAAAIYRTSCLGC